MLQIIDERLSLWGWQTGTGARFAIIFDAWGKEGRRGGVAEGGTAGSKGVVDGDVRLVSRALRCKAILKGIVCADKGVLIGGQAFKALQTAYVHLLQNPFYEPDDHTPMAVASGKGKSGQITSKKFIAEVKRIGESWKPGIGKL